MAEQQDQPLQTYRGNCHCKNFVFELDLPEIKLAHECNCSVCYKKGVLWQFPKHDAYNFVKGDEESLTTYTFNNGKFKHKFCPTCGSAIMAKGFLSPPKPGETPVEDVAINIRMIQDLDVWALETNSFDGAALPPAYVPAKFTGLQPTADIEGGKTYTGGCHCGAVKVALTTKPLDSTYKDVVAICDCSICMRGGYVWVYPNKQQVAIEGEENLKYYGFNRQAWVKSFCKSCGVNLHNCPGNLTDEQIAAMTDEERAWTTGKKDVRPINIRTLEGVDLKELEILKVNGSKMPAKYENP